MHRFGVIMVKTNPSATHNEDERYLLERYRKLALILSDWFWETDENYTIIYMSDSVKQVTGFPAKTYIGVSRFDLASAETKQTLEWKRHVEQVTKREPIKNFEYKHVGSNGHVTYLRVNATPLFYENGDFRGYLGTTTDITELILAKKRTEEINEKLEMRTNELEVAKLAAERLALIDALTGLNNRRAFFEYASTIEEQARRYDHPYSVIMLDIDFFKSVNDKHGHAAGDSVLKAVGGAIQELTRGADMAGRIGGEDKDADETWKPTPEPLSPLAITIVHSPYIP